MATESEMQKWITEDGGLHTNSNPHYLEWETTWYDATLDGNFTVEELRWIADYIDTYRKNQNVPERTTT